MKKKIIRSEEDVIYAKKDLVLMIKDIKRLEIIVITQENMEELLMTFAIKIQKTKRNSCSIS